MMDITMQDRSSIRNSGAGTYPNGRPPEPRDEPSLRVESVASSDKVSLAKVNGTVEVSPRGIVSDFDETIARGTGIFHDSHQGRFAWALTKALFGSSFSFSTPQQSCTYLATGSMFNASDWSPYAEAAGQCEDAVIRQIAQTHLGKDSTEIETEYEALVARMTQALESMLHREASIAHQLADATEVQRDEGIAQLYQSALESQVPFVICSASSTPIVELLWDFLHQDKEEIPQPLIIGNAAKKIENGFSGEDVLRACEVASIDPRKAIMLGDSIGDVGAAFLAGIRDVYIRLPLHEISEDDASKLKYEFTEAVLQLPLLHEGISGRVHLVDDFNQLKFR